jgi:hypothetical protein
MKHDYELRRLNKDGSITKVLELTDEPKCAKERTKKYAKQNPGLYWLKRTETVAIYFTEKELDEND